MFQTHYINGKQVKPPVNYEELSIELNFDTDSEERGVSVTSFEWVNAEAKILKDIFEGGVSGGSGVLVGILHKITITEGGATETIFDGYIDLTEAQFDRDKVTADSTPFDSPEFINDKADGFSYEQLYANGELTDADNVPVPYVISSIPDYTQAFLVILSLTVIIIELKALISSLAEATTKTVGYISSISGVIQLIFRIIYAILLILTVVELLLNLFDLIIQKIKYKMSMPLNRLLEAGAAHVGLIYESAFLQTALWDKAHIIPESFSNPSTQSDSRIKGFFKPDNKEQKGYFRGTFGDLLRAVKSTFNARIVVGDGKLKIVPLLRLGTNGTFRLPKHYKPEFQTNASSLISNYNIILRYDQNDRNTIDNWKGNNMNAFLEVTNVTDKRLKLVKGFKQVQIPFARGIRKASLTGIEKIVDKIFEALDPVVGGLIKVANAAIKVINTIFDLIEGLNDKLSVLGININLDLPEIKEVTDPKLGDLIDNRIGMLMLESDFITVPKLVMLDVGGTPIKTKLAAENNTHINALYLYNTFHFTNSFAPSAKSAQRYKLNYKDVEMNLADFKKVASEGLIALPTGIIADVISCQYNPSKRLGVFKVDERRMWANNIREVISEGEGR